MGVFFRYCENALVTKTSPLVDPADMQPLHKFASVQGDLLLQKVA